MPPADIDFDKIHIPVLARCGNHASVQLSFTLLQFDRDEFQEPPFRIFHVKRLWHLTVSQPPEVGARVIVRTARAGV